jgi:hypothetical protein
VQISGALGVVLSSDYPEKWPEYLNDILALLSTTDHHQVLAGILGLHELVRIYQ